jgi:predicted RNA binding protein YcfA (HicA-like mRNA interferase family)
MPRKLRELRADLRRAGFVQTRQKGNHQSWQHPALGGEVVTLSGSDGKDAKPYQERDVRRAIELVRAKEGQLP